MGQKVIPFHIAIGLRSSNGAYTVHATTKGAETTTELELPEALLALANRLLQPGMKLPISDAPALGRALGRALLAPPLRDMLLRSARSAAQENRRLQVQFQLAAPELAALPWEWVTLGVSRPWSPALRDDYALVRIARRAPSLAPVPLAGPLRVLAVASASEELQLSALSSALRLATQAGQIELQLLRRAMPEALERALRVNAPHILHCAAGFTASSNGVPLLQIGDGLTGLDLVALASVSPELRLISLPGPQGDARAVSAAPTLLAISLVGGEMPAALAFGAALPAAHSARFAAACYAKLAEGTPVDLAVTAGRRALAEQADERGWGFPQLRLAPGGEQLFQVGRASRAWRMPALAGRLPGRAALLVAGVLMLLVLLAGRSLMARDTRRDVALVGPPDERIRIQATPTLGVPTLLPATAGRLLLSSSMPTIEAPTASAPPPNAPPTGYATVLTAQGDTFEKIAARMGSDAAAIAALNYLDPQQPLRANRPLVIPVFRPGDGGAGGQIIDRGNPSKPQVALTFDIEIDDTTLYGILDILRARGLHGTFFLTGGWVEAFPDAARAIVRDGHEIGNHSLTHPFFSQIGLDGAAAELEQTEKIIKDTTGITSRPYFRFPYGDSTPDTAGVVASEGYVAYHWSADDGSIPYWLDQIAANPADGYGGILLMHGRYSTVDELPGWLDRLAAIGLQPTTLGEILK
jgi:peptidoglycan/xylan/chitin deacetylase (PgdA/CDA1 family)